MYMILYTYIFHTTLGYGSTVVYKRKIDHSWNLHHNEMIQEVTHVHIYIRVQIYTN